MKKTMTKVADEVREDLDQARDSATEALTKARLDLFDGVSAAHAKEALSHSVHALKSTAQDTAGDTVKKARKKARKTQKKAKKQARKVATASRRRGPALAAVAVGVALVGGLAAVLARRVRS